MKKLIAVVTLALAFTLSANAQDNKASMSASDKENATSETAAKKDVAALLEKFTFDETFKNDMYTLMIMKHDELSNPKLTPAQKDEISGRYERKVMGGLTPEQQKKLAADKELLKRISH